MAADWLDAARLGDQANGRRLLSGLGGYLKAESGVSRGRGRRRAAAAGDSAELDRDDASLFRPPRLAPGLGVRLFVEQPSKPPRHPAALGRGDQSGPRAGATNAGFPVTHYVGVADSGPTRGAWPGDPRAGLFGFGRVARPERPRRPAQHHGHARRDRKPLGPWAAGGDATVRPLTEGRTSTARTVSAAASRTACWPAWPTAQYRSFFQDVDPRVLEQLVTIGGREQMTVAALDATAGLSSSAFPPAATAGSAGATAGLSSSVVESGNVPEALLDKPAVAPQALLDKSAVTLCLRCRRWTSSPDWRAGSRDSRYRARRWPMPCRLSSNWPGCRSPSIWTTWRWSGSAWTTR